MKPKLITDIKEIIGKTTTNAVLVDASESLAITFSDDTCIFVDVEFCGDSHTLELCDSVDLYLERDAGFISQTEFHIIKSREEKERLKRIEERERSAYETLKAKYEHN